MSEINQPKHQSQSSSASEFLPENEGDNPSPNQEYLNDSNGEMTSEKSPKYSKEFLKNVNWYSVARKIRKSNHQLVQKIMELEKVIEDYEEKLEIQYRRCKTSDNLIEQQTQELNNAEEEMSNLYNELQNFNKEYQNQQNFIEDLSKHLQSSQEQIARLERECSSLQDDYNQQKNYLLEVEKQNKELQIRLQRQQRQTLQFKAAFYQSSETTLPENNPETMEKQAISKVNEIKPWSQEEESTNIIDPNSSAKLLTNEESKKEPLEIQEIPEILKAKRLITQEKIENKELKENSEPLNINSSFRDTEQINSIDDIPSNEIINNEPDSVSIDKLDSSQNKSDSSKKKKKKNFLQLPNLPNFLG